MFPTGNPYSPASSEPAHLRAVIAAALVRETRLRDQVNEMGAYGMHQEWRAVKAEMEAGERCPNCPRLCKVPVEGTVEGEGTAEADGEERGLASTTEPALVAHKLPIRPILLGFGIGACFGVCLSAWWAGSLVRRV